MTTVGASYALLHVSVFAREAKITNGVVAPRIDDRSSAPVTTLTHGAYDLRQSVRAKGSALAPGRGTGATRATRRLAECG